MAWPGDTAVNAVGSCAGTLLDRIFMKLIINPMTRVLNCNKNVEKLNGNLKTLVDKRDGIDREVHDAERRAEEILLEVKNWMAKADEYVAEEAKRLRDELAAKAMKRCFMGWCPNPVARYKLSKKAEEDAIAVDLLVQQRNQFTRISYFPWDRLAANRGDGGGPVGYGFQDFDSRSMVLEEIMDSLKQPSIKRIGLYGLPGVGKTTLAKEVKRRSQNEKLFDALVLAAVTSNPDLKRIQAEIARDLNLVLPNENEERKPADCIKAKLIGKKNVLVILDDVWTKLDLDEIGIPLEHTELKILLTSRNRDVLSRELCSDKNIKVGQLPDKEAWKLFVDVVGADAEKDDLKQTAIQIVEKCGGLPLAIVTLGTALKGRESDDWWYDALERLKNPAPENFEGVSGEVYAAIEFSYNHLKGAGLKETFLLCSLLCRLEENIELLVRYAVGLHIFSNNTIKATRHRVRTYVSMLKDAALLIDVNSNRKFGIHDVVRDVAMAIAARDNCGLLLEDEKQLDMEALTKVQWIFLKDRAVNIIGDLPNDIEFPLLTLFHLQPYGPCKKDLTSLFKGMQKLKVVNVSTRCMPNACLSLSFLTNLRSLTIWGVDDVTVLGELKNLEVLCVHGGIEELSSEVGKLTLLKVLDLRGCVNLKVISQNVIANLSRLEELYFYCGIGERIQWELAENGEQRNASFAELAYLHSLTVLHLSIQDVRILPTNAIDLFSRLESFQMNMGLLYQTYYSEDYSRILRLEMNEGSCLDRSVGKLLEKTEALHLSTMKGLKNVVYELDVGGFQKLKLLAINSALEMQYIVNSVDRSGSNAFPILETLVLYQLDNLERINHGRLGATSFSKLKEVSVSDCHQIKILFSLSMVRQLLQLQKISVVRCEKMVGIVDEEGQGETSNEIVEATGQRVELSQLRSLCLDNVPEFISFCYGKKSSLIDEDKQNLLRNNPSSRPIPLFNNEVVFPNLEKLELRSIKIKMIWHDSTAAHCIMNLTELIIESCNNLELLFSSSMARGFEKLKNLKIQHCKNIREIIATENVEDMEKSISFPQLNFLWLSCLQNLVKFYSGNCMIKFPSLEQWVIQNCPKLKGPIVNSTSMDAMADESPLITKQVVFPNLEELELRSNEIKMIWHSTAAHCIMNLTELTIDGCDNLELLLSSCMARGLKKLRLLQILRCKNIREIIAAENVEDMENSISFPQLNILVLNDLQNLVKFYSGNSMIEFPSLKQWVIWNCPKLKVSIVNSTSVDAMADKSPLFTKQVVFSNLEELELRSIEIKMIWHISTAAHCIMNLTKLTIDGCDNLELLLSSCMARGLKKLRLLKILRCKNIREIIATENVEDMENSISFPQLNFLKLKDLQNLVKFYSGNSMIEFPSLKQWAIRNCPKLKVSIVNSTSVDAMADKSPLFTKQVVFPKLEELKLRSIEIKMIWHVSIAAHCIMNLTELTIEACDNLELLFSSSMARGLDKLRGLTILRCKNTREIIATENVEDMEKSISFPQLSFLVLKDLESLVKFYSGNCMIEFPFLKQLAIENCPKLKGPIVTSGSMDAMADESSLFTKQVVFPKLEELELRSIEIKMIWHVSIAAHCIMNLTELTIEGCDNLELLLSSSMARGLEKLRYLTILRCKNIREIIAIENVEDMENSISFPQLNFLKLKDLQNLVKFYSGNCMIEFPSLKQWAIRNCPKLKVPIVNGPSVDAVSDKSPLFTKQVVFSNLEQLKLRSIEIKIIWHVSTAAHCIMNLTELTIEGCDNLELLFSSSMARGLEQLRDLTILRCKNIREIIATENAEDMEKSVSFPQLNFLVLKDLQNLVKFCSENSMIEFPSLKRWAIWNCPKIKGSIVNSTSVDAMADKSPLFTKQVVFPNLKELELRSIEIKMIWHVSTAAHCIMNLTELTIEGCDNLELLFSSSMARDLEKLRDLTILRCKNMREIIATENVEDMEKSMSMSFPQLNFLVLKDLQNLVKFYSGNSMIEFPSLKRWAVWNCPKIKGPIVNSTSMDAMADESPLFTKQDVFPNLKELELRSIEIKMIWHGYTVAHYIMNLTELTIDGCDNLELLFSSRMARRLKKLRLLKIRRCKNIREIIATDNVEDMENSISFPQLKILVLNDLQNLVKFYSGNCMIEFPSLERWAIWSCPKLRGPIINSTSMDAMADESPLFTKQVVCPNLEQLKLRSIEIKMIWHVSTAAQCIMNLTKLTIEGCDNLELLFSSSMARGLEKLRYLTILRCKNIGEIIATENVEDMEKSISFPQLSFLVLKDLQNLVKFYSENSMIEFPSLKQWAIWNCPKLKGPIVNCTSMDAMADESPLFTKQVVFPNFPNLEELELRSIEIKMIWHVSTAAHCIMNLTELTIEGCDNLELLLSSSMVRGLEKLRYLTILRCKNIGEIIATENVEDMEKSISFPQLSFLVLKDLESLVKFYSGNCMIEFPFLEQLAIENCPKLKGPFVTSGSMDAMADKSPLFTKQVVFPNLEELELRSIEIKMIWHVSTTAHCIMNLTELTIEGCDNLELLFSSSMARGLEKLRDLTIVRCKNIREIIATENVEGMEKSISFPQLGFLVLKDLENLVKFYSGNCMIEFPFLVQLAIENCPKLKGPIVTSGSMDAMADKRPLFTKQNPPEADKNIMPESSRG